jgi:type II secretory pathway pseudopilin PulG
MDIGILGLVIAVVSGLASFVLGRWLSNKRRQKKADQARAVAEAGQSRQVRRARERQRRR